MQSGRPCRTPGADATPPPRLCRVTFPCCTGEALAVRWMWGLGGLMRTPAPTRGGWRSDSKVSGGRAAMRMRDAAFLCEQPLAQLLHPFHAFEL